MTRFSGPSSDRRRYEITDEAFDAVRRGGQSLVYEATRGHGRYALKVSTGPSGVDADRYLERMLLFAAHPTPGVTRIIEAFPGTAPTAAIDALADEDFDTIITIEEWIAGIPLDDALRDADGATIIRWICQIARAVQALHATTSPSVPHGFVHRDLKPSNVLINDAGDAVVIDLGVGRPDPNDEDWTAGTGTHRWIAPELTIGMLLGPGALKNADRWGVGALGHWMLTGKEVSAAIDPTLTRRQLRAGATSRRMPHPDHVADSVAALIGSDETRPRNLDLWARELETKPGRPRRPLLLAVAATSLVGLAAVSAATAWPDSDRAANPTIEAEQDEPDDVVVGPGRCTDPDLGFTITVPRNWTTVARSDPYGACQRLVPVDGTFPNTQTTIEINSRARSGPDALAADGYEATTQISGRDAWKATAEATSGDSSERGVAYAIDRGPSTVHVTMATTITDNVDYNAAVSATNQIARSLELVGTGCLNESRGACGGFYWLEPPPAPTPPEIDVFEATPTDPAPSETVTFTITASDADADSIEIVDDCSPSTPSGDLRPRGLWGPQRARPGPGEPAGRWIPSERDTSGGASESAVFTRAYTTVGTYELCVTATSTIDGSTGPDGVEQTSQTLPITVE